jgi:AcrR family transcriptional regulator
MPTAAVATENAHDRLLLAAAQLLEEAQGEPVSTRAICDRAGVQAPTLYHHFGSKDGLLDSVLRHGFGEFLASRGDTGEDDDPVEAIREGWDLHVRFGLENPNFYILIYGRARPGEPCGVVADVERMILDALRPAARQRRLRIAPEQAARQILAASTGVVLTLITDPADEVDLALSDQVRDAILDALATTPRRGRKPAAAGTVSSAAIALAATLDEDPEALSAGEASLMREWLRRLSATPSSR